MYAGRTHNTAIHPAKKKNLQLKWNALLDEFQEVEAQNPAPLPTSEITTQVTNATDVSDDHCALYLNSDETIAALAGYLQPSSGLCSKARMLK